MGYESRIYVIRKTDVEIIEGFKYAETMVVYNLCVFPPFQKLFNKDCPKTQYAMIENDKDIIEDCYGDPLRERSLPEVITHLEKAIADDEDIASYARVKPLLAMLKEFEKVQDDWYKLAVIHYGY